MRYRELVGLTISTPFLQRTYQLLLPVMFFLVIGMLSIQFKEDNLPALRPLYREGIVGLLCLAALVFYRCREYWREVLTILLTSRPQILMHCFVAVCMLNSIFSGYRPLADMLYFTAYYVGLNSLFSACIGFHKAPFAKPDSTWTLLNAARIFSLLALIVGVMVRLGFMEFQLGTYKLEQAQWALPRIHGYMGDPTSFGALLGFVLIIEVYCWLFFKSRSFWLMALALVIGMIWAGSRNALMSAAFSIAAMLAINHYIRQFTKREYFGVVFLVSLLLLTASVGFLDGRDFMQHPVSSPLARGDSLIIHEQDNYKINLDDGRLGIWRQTIGMQADSSAAEWLLGHGAQTLRSSFRSAFSSPLEILFDFGLIALILFATSVCLASYVAIVRFFTTRKPIYILGFMFIAYGLTFNFFISWYPIWSFNFAAFSLIVGISLVARCSDGQIEY